VSDIDIKKNQMKSKRNALKIDTDILEAIGERIIEIRKRLKINQKEFAASIDMSPSYLSSIESGKGNPTVGFFFRLSNTHNVSLDYLFHGTGSMFRHQRIKKPDGNKEFPDSIETIDDIHWLMEHSPMSKNIIIGYCSKFLYENEEVIKENIKRCRARKGQE
jgi:transcriptional regulator with XRE-family HTH domain